MPTSYSDQFYIIDPFSPPAPGTALTVNVYTIIDQDDDGLFEAGDGSTVNGLDITSIYQGDTVTVLVMGVPVTITGTTFYLAGGIQVFTPNDGSVLSDGTFVSSTFVTSTSPMPVGDLGPPCFTPGTMILTAQGEKPVEELQVGDLLVTADNGLIPILYCHERKLSARHMSECPNHRPICINKNALGDGYPASDLTVSPQHRIMLRSKIAFRMFEQSEVLVPAVRLKELPGVSQNAEHSETRYIHILLAQHHIIFANGMPAETLYLGKQAREGFSPYEMRDILSRLTMTSSLDMEPARVFVHGKSAKKLISRHIKNQKPLFQKFEDSAMAEKAKAG